MCKVFFFFFKFAFKENAKLFSYIEIIISFEFADFLPVKSKNNLDFAYAVQKGLAPWVPLVRTMCENQSEERRKGDGSGSCLGLPTGSTKGESL